MKRRNKCRRNRHKHDHPPISKVEDMAETVAWKNNWKVAGGTEGGSTSDKCGIIGGIVRVDFSVTAWNIFVQGTNTAMKMNSAISGYSATGQKKLTTRRCAVLIGFCGVETRKQDKKNGSKLKMLLMQQRCAPLRSPQSSNNNLTLTDSPSGCGLATMLRKTYGNVDSPTDRWKTWQKLIGAYQLRFSSVGPHRKFGMWRILI